MSCHKLFYSNEVCYNNKSEDDPNESNNPIKRGKWSPEEDAKLTSLVQKYDYKNWRMISEEMSNRSPIQCLHRWTKILQPGLVKGPWTSEEDTKLLDWVRKEGPCKWPQCAKNIPGRTGKQCREHWIYSLNPTVKKGDWEEEEDFKIIFYYKKYKGGWKKIAEYFPERTANSIKNRFYCQLRKIVGDKLGIKGKNEISKIKLDTLLQYIDYGYDKIADTFRIKFNLSNEEFIDYTSQLNKDKIQREISNDTTKEISSCSNGEFKEQQFEQFDLDFLEKEICEQCDNNQFFFDQNSVNFENQLDKEIDSIFLQKVNSGEMKIDEKNCQCCNKQKPIIKDEKYHSLLNKLLSLEREVQQTKKQLYEYEKELNIENEVIPFDK